MRRLSNLCLMTTSLLTLTACGSIVSGTTQAVFVETPQVNGAVCKLNDSKTGSWHLPDSPGSVTVLKGDGPMNVVCNKEGFESGIVSVEETIAGATFGNIILGGGIGFFVDAATGAAQRYPDKIVVWMKPKEFKDTAAEEAWYSNKREFEMKVASEETLKACHQSHGENCEAKAKEAAQLACKANNGKSC